MHVVCSDLVQILLDYITPHLPNHNYNLSLSPLSHVEKDEKVIMMIYKIPVHLSRFYYVIE